MKKIILTTLIAALILGWTQVCLAKRVRVPVSGKVNSFGTYSFVGNLNFTVKEAGEKEIGSIAVEGTYNGEYPWIMRIYTDNTNYTGIAGSLRQKNPAGLVSTDGRFVIPLGVNSPNFGAATYRNIPDINQPGYIAYFAPAVDKPPTYTDCVIMGIDPRNAIWVAADNKILFDTDDNVLGDTTIPTPFDLKFRANFDELAVKANYTANLYIELVPAP